MPAFAYQATTGAGRLVRGVEEAWSPAALERALTARGLLLLAVTPAPAARRPRTGLRRRRADVVEAVRYLSTLVAAGFPLDRAVGTVAEVVVRPDVREAVLAAQVRLRAGGSLADALGERPRVFPRLAVALARAGERGGQLADALDRLAQQLEREERLRAQVGSALLYPALVAVVGGTALLVLVLYVLPRFAALLGEAGATVPRATAAVLAAGDAVATWWPLLAVGGLLLVGLGAVARRAPDVQAAVDRGLMRLPVVGGLRRQLVAARFGRSLATLLAGGLPMLAALDVAADALTDRAAGAAVRRARDEVRAGQRLAAALGRGGVLPYVFLQMVDLGERGGRLPELLGRGAEQAEQELERGLERLVRLVEPLLIVGFGLVVGVVALALLQAIYGVNFAR